MLDKNELAALAKRDKPDKKKNRTISLNDDNYEKFQDICRQSGVPCSKALDAMIAKFLESYDK